MRTAVDSTCRFRSRRRRRGFSASRALAGLARWVWAPSAPNPTINASRLQTPARRRRRPVVCSSTVSTRLLPVTRNAPRRLWRTPMPSLSSIVPYIADNKASWKNEVHRRQWASTLKTYVHPVIGHLPVAGVDTAMVLKILRPIWNTKPETANRFRGRIEAILDWAKTHTYRQGDNPARWKGHLDNVLPKRSKVRRVRHHPALRTLMFPSSWRNCATTAGRTGAVTLTQRLVRA